MGPWPLHFFFRGELIYAFISTILPLHECISNFIGLPSKLKPRKELKSRDVFFKILFVGWGNRNLKQEPRVRSPHKLDIPHVDGLNMDYRHRAGFTYRLSRLKPRASEKMGGLFPNNELKSCFFSSPILSVEN